MDKFFIANNNGKITSTVLLIESRNSGKRFNGLKEECAVAHINSQSVQLSDRGVYAK